MQPKELEKMPLRVEQLFYDLQNRVMEDIVRRIKKTGEITSTADYQIEKMYMTGQTTEYIEKEIKRIANMTDPEIWKLYDEVAIKEYTRNKTLYEQINSNFIPYEENETLQSWTNAVVRQTKNQINNISQSLGFQVDYGTKKVLTPLSEYYHKYLDRACMDILTGTFSYDTVLKRTVKELSASGIRTVDYATGYSSKAVVAARRAVMTGVNQLCGKINDKVADDLGTDVFEITYHSGARPSHWWGGMVFNKKELESICGLGTVGGLEGANCRHNHLAFFPGISVRAYTDEQLKELRRKELQTRSWQGKDYNSYEMTQKQRQMETAMRKKRSEIKMLKAGNSKSDDIQAAQSKYLQTLHQYQAFSKKMGIPEQMSRVYMDGLGRVVPGKTPRQAKMKLQLPNNIYKIKGMTESGKREIENSIEQLKKQYEIHLSSIEVGKMGKRDIFGAGPYVDDDGKLKFGLAINENIDFNKVKFQASKYYDIGRFAGKNVEDYIAHEMAHIMTYQGCKTEAEYATMKSIIDKQFVEGISGYADRTRSGSESLAEAFVRFRNGEDIPVKARIMIYTYIERWKK